MNETPLELTNRLSAAVDKMPAFPESVQRILALTRDDDCPLKELLAVIENDPVMTVKLLRILNSAFYNFPKQITSINESVTYLGMNAIKNMALSFAAMGVLPHRRDDIEVLTCERGDPLSADEVVVMRLVLDLGTSGAGGCVDHIASWRGIDWNET